MTAPARIQLSRAKGWRMPPNTVSVARPTKWGNPFKIAAAVQMNGWKIPEVTAEAAVALYREQTEKALRQYERFRGEIEQLRGKNLACWCRPGQPCHADVLLDLANR